MINSGLIEGKVQLTCILSFFKDLIGLNYEKNKDVRNRIANMRERALRESARNVIRQVAHGL